MNIVVLAGGLSTERDVSLITGKQVSAALRKNGHKVISLDVFMGYSDKEEDLEGIFERWEEVSSETGTISEEAPDIAQVKAMRADQSDCFFGPNVIRMCQAADIVFMALHGENGENGKIQAAFDLFGIRYTGTGYLSSAIAMDKKLTKEFFRAFRVPTPGGAVFTRGMERTELTGCGLNLPVVVKPCCGGSSVGVAVARTEEEYEKALEDAFSYEDQVVVEEFIEGREFSVAVIDGKAYPVIEIAPKEGFYDYKNKYQAGSTVETCPAELPPEKTEEMQHLACLGAEALGITGYSRLDFMMDREGKLYCLEANTLPGMTPTSLIPQEAAVLGMSYPELCEELIRISMEKYQE